MKNRKSGIDKILMTTYRSYWAILNLFREHETFIRSIADDVSPESSFQTALKVDSLLEKVMRKESR